MKISSKSLGRASGIVVVGVSEKRKKIVINPQERKALDNLLGWSIEKEITALDIKFSNSLLHFIPIHGNSFKKGNKIQGVLLVSSSSSKDEDYIFDKLRLAGSRVQSEAAKLKVKDVFIAPSVITKNSEAASQAILEGMLLSDYEFSKYKSDRAKRSKKTIREISFCGNKKIDSTLLKKVERTILGVHATRDLVSTPAKDCTPKDIASFARAIGKKSNVTVRVLNKSQLAAKKMNGVISVGMASSVPPAFVKLDYRPKKVKRNTPTIGLVGKGVTFDSGGLSIKGGKGMENMKCDMAGAGAVLGTFKALSELHLPIRVKGYVPTVENMIRGNAMKPGDVIKMMSGKTVEVLNTDAEGRLILADALHYADNDGCDIIIDLATLTGACMVALGDDYAGLFTNDKGLSSGILASSKATGERMWQLPLAPEYKKQLKSNVADIKNIGGRMGGATIAALFLQHFVKKARWAHIDLAGPAFADSASGYSPVGGTGYGVRTMLRFLEDIATG